MANPTHALRSAALTVLLIILVAVAVRAAETDCLVRDPSTILKRNGTYYIYGTGTGVQQFSSRDRLHWTPLGPALPQTPAWVQRGVPENRDNNSWAPDVHQFNGLYYLYYCYSTMGSKKSGLGVATNPTLDPKRWTDLGPVVQTGDNTTYNALDPCIFADANGAPWLSFGSYFSGIKMLQLDVQTGKQSAANPKIYDIANRPGVPGNAIEASYVYYHGGFYYLFVAWDGCCNGSKSTYNIRVGRSKAVTGPYLDKDGKDMNRDGGTLFLGAVFDNGTGRPPDDETGPGHAAIMQEGDRFWLTSHYEWARDRNGATTMNIQQLAWDGDGWPRAVLDPGPYQLVTALATHSLAQPVGGATANGTLLETAPNEGRDSQKWSLSYQGEGYYSLLSGLSRKALTVAGCATNPGARAIIAPFQKRDCQLWYLQQNDDGTYTLMPKSSGPNLALDVSGCALHDGVPIQLWNYNGADCQRWSFRVH